MKSAKFVLFLFYNVYKEKMFTMLVENGREAPLKAFYLKIWLVYNVCCFGVCLYPINVKTDKLIRLNLL